MLYNNNYPQQYNMGYQPQPLTQQMVQPQGLKGHPVSSLEEVRAAQIDFDGSLFIFPDLANRRIYTKKISMDGFAELNVYELTQLSNTDNTISTEDFVTKEEFKNAIEQLKNSFTQKTENQTTQNPQQQTPLNF